MKCDNCEKESEELVTRAGFATTFYVEWVCKKCYKDLEGIEFEEYNEDVHYDRL